jgi:hypothetical protein
MWWWPVVASPASPMLGGCGARGQAVTTQHQSPLCPQCGAAWWLMDLPGNIQVRHHTRPKWRCHQAPGDGGQRPTRTTIRPPRIHISHVSHLNANPSHSHTMLIKTSYHDVPTTSNGRAGTMRIFVIEPNVPEYPQAKFPGCACLTRQSPGDPEGFI